MTAEISLETIALKTAAKKRIQSGSAWRYRLMIFLRFVLAIVGGYYLAAITAIVIGMVFVAEPLKANAVLSATMLAFVLYCAVFIWVFMVNSTFKAWLGVILPSVVMTVLYWFIQG